MVSFRFGEEGGLQLMCTTLFSMKRIIRIEQNPLLTYFYFKIDIASPMVFSCASQPYLSTSALFFSP